MPVGIAVMKWDERVGTEVVTKYPEEITINNKTLMQVYSTHEYSGEAGMVSLMVGSLNIASYYTGPEKAFYIMLLLNLEEDPDAYEGGLIDVSRTILQNLDEDNFKGLIPNLFQRLSVYPTLNDEQRLAMAYQDEVKRMIINRLQDEGVVSKSELSIWLKDKYRQGFVDLDGVLIELIKREFIKEASVKGMPSELIFLTHDLHICRMPPINLLKDPSAKGLPKSLSREYLSECKNYFQSYKQMEEDSLKLLDLLLDPQVYEVLRLLRIAVVTRNDLEKLKKKGVDDIDRVLKTLWDKQMIRVFQDERQNEYYALIADIYIEQIFPKYQLNIIKNLYDHKTKANQVIMEYLNVLEDAYMAKKQAKTAQVEEN